MHKSTEFLRQVNLSQLKKKNQALKKFVERKRTKKLIEIMILRKISQRKSETY